MSAVDPELLKQLRRSIGELKAGRVGWNEQTLVPAAIETLLQFWEREPLVQELLADANKNAQSDYNDSEFRDDLRKSIAAVRDFKIGGE